MTRENLKKLLEFLNIEIRRNTKDGFMVSCPFKHLHPNFSDNHPSMGVSYEKEVFHCFTDGTKGDLVYLIKQVLKCSYEQAEYIYKIHGGGFTPKVIKPKYKIYPDYFLKAYEQDKYSLIGYRGLTKEEIDLYEIGLDYYSKRIVFPVRNQKGELMNIIGRALEPNVNPKYYHYFNNKTPLWGWKWLEIKKNTVILVEGIFDAIKLRRMGITNVMALDGLSCDINDLPECYNLILFLDNDKPAKHATYRLAEKLRNYYVVQTVEYYTNHKDPYELPEDVIRNMLRYKNLRLL